MIEPHHHVSDLRWDRLLAGELDAPAKAAVLADAGACAACAARLDALTRERDAFAQRPPLTAPRAPAPRRARWWWSAPVVLAAAAAIVLVVRARPDGDDDRDGARAKGSGPSLVVAAGPTTRLAVVASGDRIHPGDSVQAGYTAARDGFGAVLARDATGKAMAYVPSHGEVMIALAAGTARSFPESTVLDATTGEEHLIVVWCEAARPLRPLLAELEATTDIQPPAGCTRHRVILDKRVAPP